jgi:hypothetical protein
MRKSLLFGLLFCGTALAMNATASCPQDGESANATGGRSNDGKMCMYAHDHQVRNSGPLHYEHHAFWSNCN